MSKGGNLIAKSRAFREGIINRIPLDLFHPYESARFTHGGIGPDRKSCDLPKQQPVPQISPIIQLVVALR